MTAPAPRRAIVLADGDAAARQDLDAAWPGWADGATIVVAADGGARHAGRLGLRIDRWVGDGDSLPAAEIDALRAAGVPVDLVPAEKDETDTELALRSAVAAGADEVVIVGATGGRRLDHALANVALLANAALAGRTAVLVDAASRVRLIEAPAAGGAAVTLELEGRAGDLVSLIPLGGDAGDVRTDGLRYRLDGETLTLGATRGLSNVRLIERAAVTLGRGRILVVETPATLSG